MQAPEIRLRESPRVLVETRARLSLPHAGVEVPAIVLDLSTSGMGLATRAAAPMGEMFRFELQDGDRSIQGRAMVVWSRRPRPDREDAPNLGARFIGLEDDALSAVAALVERRAAELRRPRPSARVAPTEQRPVAPGEPVGVATAAPAVTPSEPVAATPVPSAAIPPIEPIAVAPAAPVAIAPAAPVTAATAPAPALSADAVAERASSGATAASVSVEVGSPLPPAVGAVAEAVASGVPTPIEPVEARPATHADVAPRRFARGALIVVATLVLALLLGTIFLATRDRRPRTADVVNASLAPAGFAVAPGADVDPAAGGGDASVAADAASGAVSPGEPPAAVVAAAPVTADRTGPVRAAESGPAGEPASELRAASPPIESPASAAPSEPGTAATRSRRPAASPADPPAAAAPSEPRGATPGARRVLAIESATDGAETVVTIRADAAFRERDVFAALIGPDPPRYLLRLSGIERLYRPTTIEVGTPVLDRLRIGHHDTRRGLELHLVLDLPTRAVVATVEREEATLRVRLRPAAP